MVGGANDGRVVDWRVNDGRIIDGRVNDGRDSGEKGG